MRFYLQAIFLFLFFANNIQAQNDTIINQKSIDKVIIGGQVYYVHIVKKGETLYSLSSVYEVSQKEIAKENPDIFLGLMVGQALKIPAVSKEKDTNKVEQETSPDFIFHRVKKGQTLYSLSKKYDVSQESIIEHNSSVKYGLSVDQVIKIPKKSIQNQEFAEIPKTVPTNDTIKISDQYIYHLVKSKETIYFITKNYKISQEILFEQNPFLKEGLKEGQLLRIPKGLDAEENFIFESTESKISDSIHSERHVFKAYSDSVKLPDCDIIKKKKQEPYTVALLLPLYLDQSDEEFYIDSSKTNDYGKKIYEKVYRSSNYIYPRSVNYLEFYEGVLMALDSLKKQGLSVNLHTFDTQGDTIKVNEILQLPVMKTVDLIIGPVYNYELEIVSRFAIDNKIKMVSPLSDNSSFVDKNPFLFQVGPSFLTQLDAIAKYVSTFKNKNIVLIHNSDSLQYNSNVLVVKNKLFNYFSVDTSLGSLLFKEMFFMDSLKLIEHTLNKNTENIIIIPSNDQAFVTSVLNNLNTIANTGYNISTIGMSRWYRFGNIDPENLYNLKTSLIVPFYIDYNNKNVKKFIVKYRNIFKTEPDQYAMHGYDVSMYFLTALLYYGEDFQNCIHNHKVDQIQAEFDFVKWYEYSGYENIGVSLIRYDEGYNINKLY